jgi:hypothetical protein
MDSKTRGVALGLHLTALSAPEDFNLFGRIREDFPFIPAMLVLPKPSSDLLGGDSAMKMPVPSRNARAGTAATKPF